MTAFKITQLLIIYVACHASCAGGNIPTKNRVNDWAKQLGARLDEEFLSASDYDTLKDSYVDSIRSVLFEKVQPKQELDAMASKITQIFNKRTEALKDIVDNAEGRTHTYHYEKKLELREDNIIVDADGKPVLKAPLFKMADYDASSPELTHSDVFGRAVNDSQSGMHTPLEVFEGYEAVLNGLVVTADIDDTFRANRARDPDLSWQYLGTQLGFLRVFPATWWQVPEAIDVDLYDVRRRPWYIEGSVSPKDVVILMDISGSVHGQTFEIMKIAVKTVLNTLGENDYVNIAWSTNLVGWVDPCIDQLVPATMINKRALAAAVDNLAARNTSNWTRGFDFAYRAFIDFYWNNTSGYEGADCHKLIMFFSDGGTEWPGDVIDKYRNETITENVRIFTYALGPHPVPPHTLRKMACENNGSFSMIVASGAIRTSIQESYLSILGKPLALALPDPRPRAVSPPYEDALGLGYVTTLSMPVFNHSGEPESGASLMGVAGVDISMRELLRHSPWKKLGPFGYTFAINPNGIVMFHPRLREPLHYMEDPPDLDLTYLEGDSDSVLDMRRRMIRDNPDSKLIDQTVTLPDGHWVELLGLNFTWRSVENTTLSLGLALPAGHKHMVVSGQSVLAGLPDCDACLLAPSWEFCPGLEGNATERWEQLDQRLRDGASGCSDDLVQHLLWDVSWTAVTQTLWANNRRNETDGVVGRFVTTDGGLTRFHPEQSVAGLAAESDPYRSSLYGQASLGSGGGESDQLVVRPRSDSGRVMLAKRIVVANSTGDKFPLAVTGVQFSSAWLWNLTHRVTTAPLPDGTPAPACDSQRGLVCWLLDTAGYVVYDSSEVPPPPREGAEEGGGRHLGLRDAEIMTALVNASVYQQTIEYDYQAVCQKGSGEASAGSLLRDPLSWLNTQLLLDSVWGLLRWLQYLRYLLTSWLLSLQTAPVSGLDEFGFEIRADSRACTQRLLRTQLAASRRAHEGRTRACEDGSCARMFRASLVDGTNLLLVVADEPDDGCRCQDGGDRATYPSYRPTEDVGPERCKKRAMYRKRPKDCYATHEDEKPFCSGAGTASASSLLMLLPPLLLMLSIRLGGC